MDDLIARPCHKYRPVKIEPSFLLIDGPREINIEKPYLMHPHTAEPTRGATRCPVLFRDQWLILIDKPAGVLSHPNEKGKQTRAAFEGAYDFHDRRFNTPEGPVWLIHRLDQDASGVLLAARENSIVKRSRSLFEEHQIQKQYLALVSGRPPWQGKWRDHLAERREKARVRSFVVRSRPPNAELRYSVKRIFPRVDLSLLSVQLITGKTHQMRVQAAFRGFPIAGDEVYGDFPFNRKLRKTIGLRRLFLHAESLNFPHPKTGRFLKVKAPLPEELEQCLHRAS